MRLALSVIVVLLGQRLAVADPHAEMRVAMLAQVDAHPAPPRSLGAPVRHPSASRDAQPSPSTTIIHQAQAETAAAAGQAQAAAAQARIRSHPRPTR